MLGGGLSEDRGLLTDLVAINIIGDAEARDLGKEPERQSYVLDINGADYRPTLVDDFLDPTH